MREWLIIEQTISRSPFAPEGSDKKGYIPRDAAEKALGRELGGAYCNWFTREDGEKLRALPEWSDTEPPGKTVSAPMTAIPPKSLASLIAEMRQWSDISNHEWDLLVRGTTPALHEFLVDHSREKIAAILDDHARLEAGLEAAERESALFSSQSNVFQDMYLGAITELAKLKAERDELAGALEPFADAYAEDFQDDELNRARAALAKVREDGLRKDET